MSRATSGRLRLNDEILSSEAMFTKLHYTFLPKHYRFSTESAFFNFTEISVCRSYIMSSFAFMMTLLIRVVLLLQQPFSLCILYRKSLSAQLSAFISRSTLYEHVEKSAVYILGDKQFTILTIFFTYNIFVTMLDVH